MYSIVVFDLDGTLMDTSEGIIKAVDYIIEEYRLPRLNAKQKRSFIGPPVQKSFQTHFNCSEECAWELAAAWRNVYKDIFLFEAVAYDGIYELLEYLRGHNIKIGVATNKREDYTKKLLDHFSLSPLFDCVAGSDFEGKRTKSDIIHICMESCEVKKPKHCLMVGDTVPDYLAAKKLEANFLGVTFGFGFKPNEIYEDITTVDNYDQIIKIIESMSRKY